VAGRLCIGLSGWGPGDEPQRVAGRLESLFLDCVWTSFCRGCGGRSGRIEEFLVAFGQNNAKAVATASVLRCLASRTSTHMFVHSNLKYFLAFDISLLTVG
jgi:hypothetical protein